MCIIFLTISTTGVPNEHLKRDRRALLDAQTKMWPKNETIYFGYADETASNFSTSNRADISGQLDEISKATCLKIEEKSAGFRGVLFQRANNGLCQSGGGWPGRNITRTIWLSPSCDYEKLQHEFFHTLGIGHTHQRDDRDNHVTIGVNTCPDCYIKFNSTRSVHLTPRVGYDFKNIMHYTPWTFGINDSLVITPNDLDYIPSMGWRINPVFTDYKQLNMWYKCGDHCPDYASLKCENGGYHHPKVCGKCVCHVFAYGDRCENLIIKKMSEDYPLIFERVTTSEKLIYANSTIRSDYNQLQPMAFMAPFGKTLKVTIEELVAPKGNMSNNARCLEECGYRGFEFIDNKDGDLTMGGKLFCCASRKGEIFYTKSNILGFSGHVKRGNTGSMTFRVEVHEPRSNATHPKAPEPEWKFPDITGNEPNICEIL